MKAKRTDRLASQIIREISDILLKKLSDPRLQWVTLTRATVSPDLHEVRVYIRTLESGAKRDQTLTALTHAEGFIRREIGLRLDWRVIPNIHFYLDDLSERGEQVFRLLNELEQKKGSPHGGTETGA